MMQSVEIRAHRIGWMITLLSVLVLAPGCVSLTTFNSPQTMKKGTGSFGGGVSLAVDRNSADGVSGTPLPVAYGRIGLGSQWDLGIKVAPYVLYTDVKYQLVDQHLDVAADLGVSYGLPTTVAVYPALYLGTDRFYVGGRFTAATGRVDLEDEDSIFGGETLFSGSFPSLMAGASLGGRFRVMPEVTVHFSGEGGTPFVLPGIGIQYRFE